MGLSTASWVSARVQEVSHDDRPSSSQPFNIAQHGNRPSSHGTNHRQHVFAVAALIAGMQRGGKALIGQPQLRFLILFAGIKVRDPALEQHYEAMRPVHALHILGDKDPIKAMTNRLIESFEKPVVIHHAQGHVVPALPPPELQRLRAFIEAHAAESMM